VLHDAEVAKIDLAGARTRRTLNPGDLVAAPAEGKKLDLILKALDFDSPLILPRSK